MGAMGVMGPMRRRAGATRCEQSRDFIVYDFGFPCQRLVAPGRAGGRHRKSQIPKLEARNKFESGRSLGNGILVVMEGMARGR